MKEYCARRAKNMRLQKKKEIEFLYGSVSTEKRQICSDKEPSLCGYACAAGRFMLEMHLMVRVHPSEARMMNDAACILVPRESRVRSQLFCVL